MLCFIWEAARYFIVIHILQLFFNPLQVPEYTLFFFWVSSYAFINLAGLFIAVLYPVQYNLIGRLIGMVKILQVLAAVLFVLYDFGVIPVLLNIFTRSSIQITAALMEDFIPLMIETAGIDFIAGLLLLLWKVEQKEENVPVRITDIEEE